MTDKACERCWHWQRIAHPLDFTLGRCGLFEREMPAEGWCGMWEGKSGEVVAFPSGAARASATVHKDD